VTGSPSRMLDWEAFTAGYFPGRHKHDHEALVAYGAYRRGEGSPAAENITVAERHGSDPEALEAWEDEGGSVVQRGPAVTRLHSSASAAR
jgi:hypothetical protein